MFAQQEVGTTFTELPSGALAFHPENGVSALQLAEHIAEYMRLTHGIKIDVLGCAAALQYPEAGGELLTPITTSSDIAHFFNEIGVTTGIQPDSVAVIGDAICVEQKPQIFEQKDMLPATVGVGVIAATILIVRFLLRLNKKGAVRGAETTYGSLTPNPQEFFDWKKWLDSGEQD